MGAARGIDEGLTGTTAELYPFQRKFGLNSPSKSEHEKAELLSNITSMVQLGSIAGSLVAFFLTDRIGRVWAVRELVVIWSEQHHILSVTLYWLLTDMGPSDRHRNLPRRSSKWQPGHGHRRTLHRRHRHRPDDSRRPNLPR